MSGSSGSGEIEDARAEERGERATSSSRFIDAAIARVWRLASAWRLDFLFLRPRASCLIEWLSKGASEG